MKEVRCGSRNEQGRLYLIHWSEKILSEERAYWLEPEDAAASQGRLSFMSDKWGMRSGGGPKLDRAGPALIRSLEFLQRTRRSDRWG